MVLARNTYRFSLLLVGYAIAYELGADGAVIGFGLGTFALVAGTLAHYAGTPAPEGTDAGAGDSGDGPGEEGGEDDARGEAVRTVGHGWY